MKANYTKGRSICHNRRMGDSFNGHCRAIATKEDISAPEVGPYFTVARSVENLVRKLITNIRIYDSAP